MSIQQSLQVDVFPTVLGWMAIVGADDQLHELSFGFADPGVVLSDLRLMRGLNIDPTSWFPNLKRRLQAFAEGEVENFADIEVATDRRSGAFELAVIRHCREIPFGQVRTYGELAAIAGSPRAARAVGNCMSRNRTPLVTPCHRVVAAGSKPGNYSAGDGVRSKLRLLEMEGHSGFRESMLSKQRA